MCSIGTTVELRNISYCCEQYNLRKRDNLEDLGVDGRIILNLSSRSRLGRDGLHCSSSGLGKVGGPL